MKITLIARERIVIPGKPHPTDEDLFALNGIYRLTCHYVENSDEVRNKMIDDIIEQHPGFDPVDFEFIIQED